METEVERVITMEMANSRSNSMSRSIEIAKSMPVFATHSRIVATTSIALNIAEGNGRVGKDRLHCFRIGKGSALEVHTSLRLAVTWGHVEQHAIEHPLTLVNDVIAMLTGLLR